MTGITARIIHSGRFLELRNASVISSLLMALARFGLVTAGKLLRWWRYAVVVAFVVAAIITPSIDPITQGLVAGPIIVLYGVGIGLAWLVRRPRAAS